ncbi:MAG: Lrp/AsnC ligand binding domain-containing protein [Candidatus Thorarchaeota archaeon]
MITAFVSMSVTPGSDEELITEFARDDIVSEAWLTTGEFDVLLILEAADQEEVNSYVNNTVRNVEGVIRVVVAFGIESVTDSD